MKIARRLRPTMVAATTPAKPLIKRPEGRKYRTVLSIDGGGLRGIIPAMVLQRLEYSIKDYIAAHKELIPESDRGRISTAEDFDVDLTDYFDLVAGTSIGSWLAAYIAGRGRGCDEILNNEKLKAEFPTMRRGAMETVRAVFHEYGDDVFPRRNLFNRLWSVFDPLYPSDGLESTLKKVFGDSMFSDMDTACLITSFDLEKNVACSFLHDVGPNAKAYTVRSAVRESPREDISDGAAGNGAKAELPGRKSLRSDLEIKEGANYYVRDIAHASSAAPYYFRPARISEPGGNGEELVLVDGGMVANNPTLQALTYAPTFLPGSINDIAVFSVGCGTTDPASNRRTREPGIGWWFFSDFMLDIFRDGASEYVQGVMDFWLYGHLNYEMGQYVRIQRKADPESPAGRLFTNMDDASLLNQLQEQGKRMADANKEGIKDFVSKFLFA